MPWGAVVLMEAAASRFACTTLSVPGCRRSYPLPNSRQGPISAFLHTFGSAGPYFHPSSSIPVPSVPPPLTCHQVVHRCLHHHTGVHDHQVRRPGQKCTRLIPGEGRRVTHKGTRMDPQCNVYACLCWPRRQTCPHVCKQTPSTC